MMNTPATMWPSAVPTSVSRVTTCLFEVVTASWADLM